MQEKSKINIVQDYLEAGNYITDVKAAELCQSYRLSAIIFELRHSRGLNVQDRWRINENTGNRYKEYYLLKEVK